jgi:chloramphenicol-sensitive protein RarD
LNSEEAGVFGPANPVPTALFIGAGIVTALPMVMFANAANRLPLSLLGFIQYLSPTIALLTGIFLYHEPFTQTHAISFGLIWLALAIFSKR